MMTMVGSCAEMSLAWNLFAGDVISSSSAGTKATIARTRFVDEDFSQRALPIFQRAPSAGGEIIAFPYPDRPEEALVSEINGYALLPEGWDGERAAKPLPGSIESAVNFVRALGGDAIRLEPSLNTDGTVMLETDDGWAIRFTSLNEICSIFPTYSGIDGFDGISVPPKVMNALTNFIELDDDAA